MPRGDKRKYTEKQKRQAEHIEEGYKERGLSSREAARRAWATVNAVHKGGEKPGGGGYGKKEDHAPMRKGGRIGGKASGGRRRARGGRGRLGAKSPTSRGGKSAARGGGRKGGRGRTTAKRTARKTRTQSRRR